MNMRKNFFNYFNNFPYFTKQSLILLADKFNIGKNSLNTYIQRAIKKKEVIPLKRGVYVTWKFFNKNKNKTSYTFYLSNVLMSSSYVTRESALQYYGLLSEAVLNIVTANTLKTPRKFKNCLGFFEYRNIKNDLFRGFIEKEENNFKFLIAEPHKAIFDYLYYRAEFSKLNSGNLEDILDELRIDHEDLSNIEKGKLIKLIKESKNG